MKIKILFLMLYCSNHYANSDKNRIKLIEEFKSFQQSLSNIPESFLNLYTSRSILSTIIFLNQTKSFQTIPSADLLIHKNTFPNIKLIPKNYREFKEEESKLYKAYVALKEKDLELIKSLYSYLEYLRYTITDEIANFELLKKEAYNSKKFAEFQSFDHERDEFAGLIHLYHRYYEHNPYHLECVKPFSGYISDQSSDDDDPFARFNVSTTGISDPKEKRVTFNLTQPYCETFDCSHS